MTQEVDPNSGNLMYYVLHWVLSGFAVLITSKIIPGFNVRGFFSAMAAAVMIAVANAFIWPVLMLLTLPINIMTLGLFTLVVNGAVLKIASAFIAGFEIDGWIAAIIGSVILSIVKTVLHYAL